MVIPEEANVFDQLGLDVFIEEKLGKNLEFLAEKLKGEVDGSVHDADAVGANRVGHVPDVDRVQILVVGRFLHENLIVQVVKVLGDEDVDVAHDFQDVETLRGWNSAVNKRHRCKFTRHSYQQQHSYQQRL